MICIDLIQLLVDYICGLDDYSLLPWRETSRWEFVEAFCTGYAEYNLLSQLEAEAITMAWRLQRASSIVYWMGWFREGKVTDQKILDAVANALLFEDWLEDNAAKLLNCITWS